MRRRSPDAAPVRSRGRRRMGTGARVGSSLLLIACLTAISLGLSCGGPGRGRPNVVLIVIDTLRRDHLPFYGYARETAPFLSRLAERGAVFERAHSTSSWTAPATASLFTSLHPHQHNVQEGLNAAQVRGGGSVRFSVHALPEEAETIGEVMKRAGYGTFAVSDNINISPLASFHQGFDRFWYSNDAGSEHVNATLEEQAERIREAAPYFLYLHYMDPHRPYARRAPWYAEQADTLADETAAYDSEIRAVDAAIEEAFTLFGWNESAIVIVTADHGEEFLEHGGWDHGRTLYSEVLDLPLLFFSSAGTFLQTRFAERVSILDVLPTLRALVGARPEPGDGGVNLLPALTGAGSLPRDRMLFADLHQPPWFGGETLKSLIHGDEKLIWTLPDGLALYDLAADPGEKSDRCAERRSQAEEAREQIRRNERERKTLAAARAEVDLEREQVDKLRALGYVR